MNLSCKNRYVNYQIVQIHYPNIVQGQKMTLFVKENRLKLTRIDVNMFIYYQLITYNNQFNVFKASHSIHPVHTSDQIAKGPSINLRRVGKLPFRC